MENTTFNITDYTVMADSALQMNDTMNTSSLSLEEIGWKFCTIRASEFYTDSTKAMEKLWNKLI